MRDGFLLVVSGPSGVGKGTVCEKLISQKNDIVYSVSATTRKKRPYEIDGENYYFLSLDEFKKKIEQGDFIEYANVHNNYYGTPKSFVFDQINRRIEGRNTEDEETINIRMQNAKKELSFIDEYDYAVINEDVDETVKNIETIIDAEKFRVVKGEKYD